MGGGAGGAGGCRARTVGELAQGRLGEHRDGHANGTEDEDEAVAEAIEQEECGDAREEVGQAEQRHDGQRLRRRDGVVRLRQVAVGVVQHRVDAHELRERMQHYAVHYGHHGMRRRVAICA